MGVQSLGVVGCGLMGTGLVEVAALAGFDVVAVKATPGLLDDVASRVDRSMARAVSKGKLTAEARDVAMSRIAFTSDMGQLETCELVVESVIESLAEKQRVLPLIEEALPPSAVLGSNTSSLPLSELAKPLARPNQFLGLHFFSPVPLMKLVEVAPLPTTDEQTVRVASSVIERLGKVAIRTGEGAGYIVNRLLVPYLCHAIESLEYGVAGAKDIDSAMRLGCSHPLGPLALSDLIGLDVVLAMAQSLQNEHVDKRFHPPSLLRRLVLRGHLGKKSGIGIFDYRGEDPVENPLVRAAAVPAPAA